MAIPITLQEYLNKCGVSYDVMSHSYTTTSMNTAQALPIPSEQLAKSVVLEDEHGYLMAVIPATHHVQLGQLSRQLKRRLGLATEQELSERFSDCELGAIPPIGEAYSMDVIVEDDLNDCPDIYFEAGDHTEVIHLRGEDFQQLMQHAEHGHFSQQK